MCVLGCLLVVVPGCLCFGNVVQLRGIQKSGTTWMEIILLNTLHCYNQLSLDPGLEVIPAYRLEDYKRNSVNNEFFVNTKLQTDNALQSSKGLLGSLDQEKALSSRWEFYATSKHTLTAEWQEEGREKHLHFHQSPAERKALTVLVLRDPRDTALSYWDWRPESINSEVDLVKQVAVTRSLGTLLGKLGMDPQQLVRGDFIDPKDDRIFFWHYEFARSHFPIIFQKLVRFLGLVYSPKCAAFAEKQSSMSEMSKHEEQGHLPGNRVHKKVNTGSICHWASDERWNLDDCPQCASIFRAIRETFPENWFQYFVGDSTGAPTCQINSHILEFSRLNSISSSGAAHS